MAAEPGTRPTDPAVTLTLGHEQLVIQQRYQTVSILNDFLIAGWFLIGSVLFLYPAWERWGVWLFVIGSAQFMVRPMIRLAHRIHLRQIPSGNWDM